MKTKSEIFSMVMAIIMLVTVVPATVFAQDNSDEDILVYNLGKQEVTIRRMALGETGYTGHTFNSDGSYTIQLEDDAFFPYEIQFKYGDNVVTRTFDTPNSVITVGGHEISVFSDSVDPYAISQIGVYIGGEYIPAVPERKSFTNSSISLFSIQPHTHTSLSIDLTDRTPDEMKSVEFSVIRTAVNGDGKVVLWDYKDENGDFLPDKSFRPVSSSTVDLSSNGRSIYFNMLVSDSANQLDYTGARTEYRVTIDKLPTISRVSADVQLFAGEGADRKNISSTISMLLYGNEIISLYKDNAVDSEYHLVIKPDIQNPYTYKIYNGQPIAANDVTAQITGDGYKANYKERKAFTIVYTYGSYSVTEEFTVEVDLDPDSVSSGDSEITFGVYRNELNSYSNRVRAGVAIVNKDKLTDASICAIRLYSGNALNVDYFVAFSAENISTRVKDNSIVTKAVVGHYNTLAAASSQPDIKSQLFPENINELNTGYRANFMDGVKFTVFVGEKVYKYTLYTTETPGSDNTYINITGADGIADRNIYKILTENDSASWQFGYQIFLVDDASVNFAALKPVFTTGYGLNAYVNGTKQDSGISEQNFSGGKSVQYVAASESGQTVQNYWVSFIPKVTGPKLFVVVDGQKPDEREIFFDSHTDNIHDIFIANIGDADLTNLNVTLENPVNVKMDDYWKIGGSGNDTLRPFTSANDNYYGELNNIAKVRLVSTGTGAVSGTLKITSNGGSYTIKLQGQAGDPKIITESIPNAVKFVPYATIFTSDNKYPWNRTTFSLYGGNLPDGMMIRPNGELYGVPKEAGTFNFSVRMSNSGGFTTRIKAFTLTVLPNTDTNVDNSIDVNYSILNSIPRNMQVVPTQDMLFRSEGIFGNFIDFWIDGNKLTEGIDYDANEGSTAITIRAQTFANYGNGLHTIAIEFRTNGDVDKELKRTAQNYEIGRRTDPGNNNYDASTGTSGGGGGSSSERNISGLTASSLSNASGTSNTVTSTATAEKLTFKRRGVNFVSLAELKRMAADAQKDGKSPWFNADSVIPGKDVDVRVGINPALATKGMYFAASSNDAKSTKIKTLFEKYFSNEISAVVTLSQTGSFGQPAIICVKIDTDTNAADLAFYSYNAENNSYRAISQPNAWIDKNGYVHFTTTYADNIVISDGALAKK